ncbi:MAG: HD domain-containing protein [Coriobacteriia bacterium]
MEAYLLQRADLITSARPSQEAAWALSALTDEAVRDLSRAASSLRPASKTALVALGGWGTGALVPSSDLDLLVLSEASAADLKPYVEAVLYPLWDAGLKVGHQVRTPKEQARAMRTDLATCTAALTARPLAGDADWAESVLADLAADAHKRSRRLLKLLAERPRPGSPYLLEPDLKETAGGRRDYDELVWTAAIVTGSIQRDPSVLHALGLLSAPELAEVLEAAAVIASARFALSREGFGNRMGPEAAEFLGGEKAKRVQRALATTALALTRVRRRVGGGGARPGGGPLAREGGADAGARLFALLDGGEASLPRLEEAAESGALDPLIPGFRALMATRRPGLAHEYTVGAHSLRTAVFLGGLPRSGALAESRAAVGDLRALQVAALTHDLGKAEPGPGHAERGARPAYEAARLMGLAESSALHAAELVRRHLVLAEEATRIDIDDEDAILRAAALLGSRDLLAPLHVLTAADSLATGTPAWGTWKASLIGTLVSRLDAAFSEDVDGAGLATRGEAVRAEALAALPAAEERERAFVLGAPLRYLAGRMPAKVARDARLVAGLSPAATSAEVRLAVEPGPAEETWALTVVAHDRPELLARIAGAISLAGLDVLAVNAYGAAEGIALDSFIVTSATLDPASTGTFARLERLLQAALRDRLELQVRLAERRRHYPPSTSGPIRVELRSAAFDTSVRVTAPDRPGLLHDLARAVSATGLDIRWATALTVDGSAVDTFHVTGLDGDPVTNPGVLGHLAMRIREIE